MCFKLHCPFLPAEAQVWARWREASEGRAGAQGGRQRRAGVKDEFADDCFHMVTQYNWEEEIIWNGEDIKYKVRWDAG